MQRRSVLLLLSLAELFAMTVWFSVSAVSPALKNEFGFGDPQLADLVMAVQLGFVAGTLLFAITNVSDVFNTRRVFALSAVLAACSNAAYVWAAPHFSIGLMLRFVTGLSLAGVYPPGMKILAGWFKKGRGFAIGTMVGALAIGSALPHWVGSLLRAEWQLTLFVSSGLALISAFIVVFFVSDGPYHIPAQKFNWMYAIKAFRDRPIRLAYFGYFGHMWELYAMWTWLPAFLLSSLDLNTSALPISYGFAAFLIIGSGAIGCVLYGFWADRIGRSLSTIIAMAISGLCCLLVGHLDWVSPILLLTVCVIWGITVVADSAQFSAAVTELCEPEYMGTVLTLQTSIGFLITMASIRLLPLVRDVWGWGPAFGFLAFGPVFGIVAMALLYRSPQAVKMAGGNR